MGDFYRFSEKYNIGFHEPSTSVAFGDGFLLDVNFDEIVVVGRFTVDATL